MESTPTRRTRICFWTSTSHRISAGFWRCVNHRSYEHWDHLTEGLRTGLPQNEVRGGGAPVFEALYADPARLKEFLKAMSGVSHGANMAIAAKFSWAQYKTVVDAGPAQGDLLTQVLLKNEHLLGIGFDLPEVGPIFEEYVEGSRIGLAAAVPAGQLLQRCPAERRCGHDGTYSARLES